MKLADFFLAPYGVPPVPLPKSFLRSTLDSLQLQYQFLQSSTPILRHDEFVSSLYVTGLLARASGSSLFQRMCRGVRWGCYARKPHPLSPSPIHSVSSFLSLKSFIARPRGLKCLVAVEEEISWLPRSIHTVWVRRDRAISTTLFANTLPRLFR